MKDQAVLEALLETLFEQQTRTDRLARALWLSCVEGKPHREIGEELGVSHSRVGQMVTAGLRRLRLGIGIRPEKRARVIAACPDPILDAVFADPAWRARVEPTTPSP